MTLRRHLAIVLLTILFASAAGAHHNMSALFDFDNRVTATGTLIKADWRNPHIQLTVEVSKDGQTETWVLRDRRLSSSRIATSAKPTSKARSAKP